MDGNHRDQPVTERGRNTRNKLLDAARVIFARDGFVSARIIDIADEAGVAHGTFYTYFDSKEEILREVALNLQDEMLEEAQAAAKVPPTATPFERILHNNRQFLQSYRRHAAMIATLDQVATFSEMTREIRREARVAFVARTAQGIVSLTEQGLADPDLDPTYLANTLGSMVERSAYVWFVLNEPHDFEEAVRTLSVIWARAIRLKGLD